MRQVSLEQFFIAKGLPCIVDAGPQGYMVTCACRDALTHVLTTLLMRVQVYDDRASIGDVGRKGLDGTATYWGEVLFDWRRIPPV